MDTLILNLNQIAEEWAPFAWHVTWQAALVALLLLAVVRLGHRWPSPWRYALLLLALVKFLMPPTLGAPTGLFTIAGPEVVVAKVEAASPTLPLSQPATGPMPVSDAARNAPTVAATSSATSSATTAPTPPQLTTTAIGMLAHLLGIAIGMLIVMRNLLALRREANSATPIRSGQLFERFRRVCKRVGLQNPPQLLLSGNGVGPAAFGYFRRQIILPEVSTTLSPQELDTVLAHEAVHHRRHDLWVHLLQTCVQVLWWFNPIVWLVGRALSRTREECCDDVLLADGVCTDEKYCTTLLRTASFVSIGNAMPAAASMTAHGLARRFRRIMDNTIRRTPRLSRAAAVAVLGAAGVLLPGLATQAETPREQHTIQGRVLDEQGNPVAAAKLFLCVERNYKDALRWLPMGTSANDGTFVGTVGDEDFTRLNDYYRALVAIAPGHGMNWVRVKDEIADAYEIELPATIGITGQLLDLEGRPVAGATVTPYQLRTARKKDDSLQPWLEMQKKDPKAAIEGAFLRLPINLNQPGCWQPVTTDDDGRFTIDGIGREQVVTAVVSGPSISTDEIAVLTRDVEPFEGTRFLRSKRTYYGKDFEHIVAPGRKVHGRITDEKTGAGIGGIELHCFGGGGMTGLGSRHLTGTTDANGNYEIHGLKKTRGYYLMVKRSMAKRYLEADAQLEDPPGLAPIEQDFQLARGVVATCRVVEKGSGKPVEKATLMYEPSGANTFVNKRIWSNVPDTKTDRNGVWKTLVYPGKGYIIAYAKDGFLTMAQDGSKPLKDGETTVGFSTENTAAVRGIEPSPGDDSVEVTLEISRGVEFPVRIIDAKGQPVEGSYLFGAKRMGMWQRQPQPANAKLEAFNPEIPRVVYALHREKKMVGMLELAKDAEQQVIRLEPAGGFRGQLFDPDDQPLPNAMVTVKFRAPGGGPYDWDDLQPLNVRTADDGTFVIEPIIPGCEYRIAALASNKMMKGGIAFLDGLTQIVKEGIVGTTEMVDFGKLKLERKQ